MSDPLEHREIDPQVCPRCGNEWTEEAGQDRDRDEDEAFGPDEIRSCPECEKRAADDDLPHDGTYQLTYKRTLQCVSWTDDEGQDHVVRDTEAMVADEAMSVLREFVADVEAAGVRVDEPDYDQHDHDWPDLIVTYRKARALMPMSKEKPSAREVELEKALLGMAGYLCWSQKNRESIDAQWVTLSHDIMGLARHEQGFAPRTSGYGKYLFQEPK